METKTTWAYAEKSCAVPILQETLCLKYCPKYVLFRKNGYFEAI